MGEVLRKLTEKEIMAFGRLALNSDFKLFKSVLIDTLNALRENSDMILDDKLEYVSKGRRQAIKDIIDLTTEENIRSISDKMLAGGGK